MLTTVVLEDDPQSCNILAQQIFRQRNVIIVKTKKKTYFFEKENSELNSYCRMKAIPVHPLIHNKHGFITFEKVLG